jgi:Zn-finger nucleic acid-binding protein
VTIALDPEGKCVKCEGGWLDKTRLPDKVVEELEVKNLKNSTIACPACGQRLTQVLIFDVPIDSCVDHGLWFDRTELDEVIHRSRNDAWRLYDGRRPSMTAGTSIIETLLYLFRRP